MIVSRNALRVTPRRDPGECVESAAAAAAASLIRATIPERGEVTAWIRVTTRRRRRVGGMGCCSALIFRPPGDALFIRIALLLGRVTSPSATRPPLTRRDGSLIEGSLLSIGLPKKSRAERGGRGSL